MKVEDIKAVLNCLIPIYIKVKIHIRKMTVLL